jgi:hypothetical protein
MSTQKRSSGDAVQISSNPGKMTHSGLPVGPVDPRLANQPGFIVDGPEYGDYLVSVTLDGESANHWIAADHLGPRAGV